MRWAVFSDIHGNIEAFEQVLKDVALQEVRGCYFLGDAISYGPEPEACVQLLKKQNIPCILGNHELALLRPEKAYSFNEPTRLHFLEAVKLISKDSYRFIATWPAVRKEHGMLLVHGCPPDSVTRYLHQLSDYKLLLTLQSMDASICFIGHTHELEVIEYFQGEILRQRLGPEKIRLRGEKSMVNTGSVGQPRDGNNRAKYVIWDTEEGTVEARYIEYDVEKTVQGILARGFPEYFALRLR